MLALVAIKEGSELVTSNDVNLIILDYLTLNKPLSWFHENDVKITEGMLDTQHILFLPEESNAMLNYNLRKDLRERRESAFESTKIAITVVYDTHNRLDGCVEYQITKRQLAQEADLFCILDKQTSSLTMVVNKYRGVVLSNSNNIHVM